MRDAYEPADKLSAETLAELRTTLGEAAYLTEFECEWSEGEDAVFTAAELARILGTDAVPDQLDDELPLPDDDTDSLDLSAMPTLTEILRETNR